jgi:hypothetical protein
MGDGMNQLVPISSPALPGLVGAAGEHASTRTMRLYDRRRDQVSLDEVEQIAI